MFRKVQKLLKNKKTYIQAFIVWAYGIYQSYVAGGGHGFKQFFPYLMTAGIAMSLKAGQSRLSK